MDSSRLCATVGARCDPQKRRSRIDGQTVMRATTCELVFDAVEILHAVATGPSIKSQSTRPPMLPI